jgi:hypothetical protein
MPAPGSLLWEAPMTILLAEDGRVDKGNCTAGRDESHGYQGLPGGGVRTSDQGNQNLVVSAGSTIRRWLTASREIVQTSYVA